MIDIHSHILPGLDDGAASVEDSLEMARQAVKDGITHLVCTPHIHYGRYNNTTASIAKALGEFKEKLKQNKIDLQVSYGAEVRISAEVPDGIAQGNIPAMGSWEGKPVVMIEFPQTAIPVGTENLIQWLKSRGVVPLIAHPERNRIFQADHARLDYYVRNECLLQITGSSIYGQFGQEAQRLAHALIEQGSVHFVASDAHNLMYRPPRLTKAVECLLPMIGEQEARRLVYDHPRKLTHERFSW